MIDQNFEIKTKRLIVRPFRPGDFEIWRQTFSTLPKPQNRWDKSPRKRSELTQAKFDKILATQKKNRLNDYYYDFVAFDKKTGCLIGFCSLMDISRAVFQNAYLGYGVFSPYWGQGFGKEMVLAVVEVAFKKLLIHRVEAGIEPANKRSIALAKAIGMRREGLSKRRLYLDEAWRDMAIYALTAEDFGHHSLTGALTSNRL